MTQKDVAAGTLAAVIEEACNKPLVDYLSLDSQLKKLAEVIKTQVGPAFVQVISATSKLSQEETDSANRCIDSYEKPKERVATPKHTDFSASIRPSQLQAEMQSNHF